MESDQKAFFVGISAVRITDQTEDRKWAGVQVGLNHHMLVTFDRYDAEQTGREKARKQWPESEGWAQHSAEAAPISRDDMAELLECFPDLAANADFEKEPGMVM